MLQDSNLTLACSVNCLTLLENKLFIKQSNKQIKYCSCRYCSCSCCCNKKEKIKTNQQAQRLATSSVALLVAICLTLCLHQVNGQSSLESRANLPTVIVRGFLNYRTTVDGTVLLFTPDAGGSATSGSQTIQATSSAPVLVQTSANFRVPIGQPVESALQIEPTSVHPQQVISSTTFFIGGLTASSEEPPAADRHQVKPLPADEWRPIQATPPLARPVQTLAKSPAGDQQDQQLVSQSQPASSSAPSVQADDVISVAPATGATGSPPPTQQSGSSARAARPKRPSLGFNGQGTRSKPSAGNRPQTSNQAEAQSSNTINGIRRPGYSTPAPAEPAEAATSGAGGASSQALKQRVFSASAKLRNRFKKPSGSAFNSSLSGNSGAASAPSALVPAESGEDALVSSELLVPSVQGISPERPSAMQARMGDLFNSGEASIVGPSAVVGSDEVLVAAAAAGVQNKPAPTSGDSGATLEPLIGAPGNLQEHLQEDGASLQVSSVARSGEQRPAAQNDRPLEPQLLSGGLTGSLEQGDKLGNINFDNFFQSDQPANSQPVSGPSGSGEASEHHASHHEQPKSAKNNNDKLTSWLGQHHNKFVPRPTGAPAGSHGDLSQQLSQQLNSLVPSFSSNIPASTTSKPAATMQLDNLKPSVGSLDELETNKSLANNATSSDSAESAKEPLQLQTITKTYSTVMTSLKTRLVPLQVKSSTAIHTITENYVITKLLTAYQTMPVGEFILPEPLSTRAPFEIFNEQVLSANELAGEKREQPIAAPALGGTRQQAPESPTSQQEQPISLDSSPKSANDWLHDFTNPSSQLQQQQPNLAALLEQQAQEANLAGFSPLGEPLDQLASSLDPAADGTINIPDLNNPLVLAAAIQNPQLAAVILAAQQLQLKQRANKLNQQVANNQQQQHQSQLVQLQPSYSTSLSTTIRPSTYTVRDTMYTTRLVSFKDGRTVRTRTVSEPGSVIEQVLTTMATELIPITVTIRPSQMLSLPVALNSAQAGQQVNQASNQATLNNALFATQLASLLARRQQQVQPSMANSALFAAASNQLGGQPPLNQLAALQQLIGQQQQQQQQQQQVRQFQPNFQQLLQSMQQQQQQQQAAAGSAKPAPGSAIDKKPAGEPQQPAAPVVAPSLSSTATPTLNAIPLLPITTTLTNLQVRTYTVHNAFKTIYRTITSTQLITSTIFPAGVAQKTGSTQTFG